VNFRRANRAAAMAVLASAALGSLAPRQARAQTVQELAAFEHVSLVFASEDVKAPVSMFGHTFIVFHNEPFPEPDAIAVEFVGRLDGVSFGIVRSLFATIPGQYRLRSFRDKELEYEGEDRALWIYTVRLDADERAALQRSIALRLVYGDDYNFVIANCSQRVHSLLTESMKGFTCRMKPHAMPVDSVRALSRCGRVERTIRRPAQLEHALALHASLTSPERAQWARVTSGSAPVPADAAAPAPRSAVGEAAGAALDYRLPREADAGLRTRLFLAKKQLPWGASVAREVAPGLTERGQSLLRLDASPARWGRLTFALAEQGLPSQGNAELMNSQVDLLRASGTFAPDGVRLAELVAIDVAAMVGRTALSSGIVRKVFIGYRDFRQSAAFPASELELELGGGVAARAARWLSLGLVLSGGFGRQALAGGVSYSFFPRALAQLTAYPGGVFRFRVGASAKLWDYRTVVVLAQSELALLLGSRWTLVGAIDAMGDSAAHGVAGTLGVALTF
jgi:hypothetical protein